LECLTSGIHYCQGDGQGENRGDQTLLLGNFFHIADLSPSKCLAEIAKIVITSLVSASVKKAGVFAMTMIEVPDNQAAALKAKAALQGLTLQAWLGKLAEESAEDLPPKPLKAGRGMLAKYGSAPSAEEIDENRKDMFHGFAESF
jgi:hypothetical protein